MESDFTIFLKEILKLSTDPELVISNILTIVDIPLWGSKRELIQSYKIGIFVPPNYPKEPPKFREMDGLIPKDPEHHVNDDGFFCLAPRVELFKHWHDTHSISNIIKKLVTPFLAGQKYFEINGRWPAGEYSHGAKGILEYYQEILKIDNYEMILKILNCLVLGKEASPNKSCFCGSDKKFKNCHDQMLFQIKRNFPLTNFVNPFLKEDLADLEKLKHK